MSPVLIAGAGTVAFDADVTLGLVQGPGQLSGYTYIEARSADSVVRLGESTRLANGVCIVSEGPGIMIGKRCLIGPGVQIYDSDFHALDATERDSGLPGTGSVVIGDDVFIGSKAIILKRVSIESGSIVGAGAVVTRSVSENTIVAGNPARQINR